MIENQFKCDICTAQRTPANHWLLVMPPAHGVLRIEPWDNQEALREGVQHICGAECAHKVLDRHLEFLRSGGVE
ncbi:MAG: hypothetical protein KGJ13_10935 [Patescibacteria group bacterium]|nr:hypothetical protein [Patescibacteria group bacterium]